MPSYKLLTSCLLVAASAQLAACGEEEKKPAPPPREDILTQPQRLGDNGDFYLRFEGQGPGGERITLQVQKHGQEVVGAVNEQLSGLPMLLLQDNEDSLRKDSTYVFVGYDFFHKKGGAAPTWTLQCRGGAWTAQQLADTLKKVYALQPAYPEGSVQLAAITVADTLRLLPGRTDPNARMAHRLVAAGGGMGAQLINNTIRQLIDVRSSTELNKRSISAALADHSQEYFRAWRSDVGRIYDTADHEGAFMYNSSQDENITVLRNEEGWLVLRDVTAQYSGGAHANTESSYYTLDLQGGRAWSLTDIVSDTLALKPLLNAAARQAFGMDKAGGLNKRLLVSEVPVTENAYVLRDGLAFVYNPYEIASYADGEVHLFIPWQQLRLLLTPAFRARLSGTAAGPSGGSA